jgi:hypothetical protein
MVLIKLETVSIVISWGRLNKLLHCQDTLRSVLQSRKLYGFGPRKRIRLNGHNKAGKAPFAFHGCSFLNTGENWMMGGGVQVYPTNQKHSKHKSIKAHSILRYQLICLLKKTYHTETQTQRSTGTSWSYPETTNHKKFRGGRPFKNWRLFFEREHSTSEG